MARRVRTRSLPTRALAGADRLAASSGTKSTVQNWAIARPRPGGRAMVQAMGSGIRAFTYDGHTPQDARKPIRDRAQAEKIRAKC